MGSRFAAAFTLVWAGSVAAFVAGCSGSSATDLHDPNGPSGGGPSGGGADPAEPPTGTSTEQPESSTPLPDPSTVTPSATTPIEIRNVSLAAGKSHGYGENALDVTFAVVNRSTRPVERLNEISLTFGGQKRTFAAACDGVWFGTLGTSKILVLHLEDTGAEGYLFPECGQGISGPTMLPWGDAVTVELRGLLDDASPWVASASGSR